MAQALRHLDFLIPIAVLLVYLLVPILIAWGWIRWLKEKKPRNVAASFSYASFALATLSLLYAVYVIGFAHLTAGSAADAPSWEGLCISAIATILAFAGLWRTNPLRWHATLCSLAMLFLWSTTMLE